jgi:hypothetical protein
MLKILVTLSAVGEIAVGLLAVVLPETMLGLLLGKPVTGTGAMVARVAGFALASLGLSWLAQRNAPDGLGRIAASYLTYNLGVGLVFLLYAWRADSLLIVPWVVAVGHLTFGIAFIVRRARS